MALDAFFADLRASGYPIDPGQLAAANQLVLMAVSGAWPDAEERLGNLLSPIFSRTPTEQLDILRRVEAWRPLLFPRGARLASLPLRRIPVSSSISPPSLPPLRI